MLSPTIRLIIAVVVAPLATALVLLLYMFAHAVATSRYEGLVGNWLFMSVFAVPISYLATLVVGLPTHMILRMRNRQTTFNYVIVGVAVTLLPFVAIPLIDGTIISSDDLLLYPVIVVGSAAAVSWTFAKIALSPSKTSSASENKQ